MRHHYLVIPALAGALLFTGAALADDSSEKQRRGPPPVAIEACAAAVEGDPCSFEGRRGNSVEGSCASRDDKPLACRPDRHGKRDRSEPLESQDGETE